MKREREEGKGGNDRVNKDKLLINAYFQWHTLIFSTAYYDLNILPKVFILI